MDIEKIRAQLRAEAGHKPRSSSMTNPAVLMVAICAVLLGVLYYPFFQQEVAVPLQPSAAIPTFRNVAPGKGTIQSPSTAQRGEAQLPGATQNAANYAGLSPRETGKVADAVCLARAHARYPHWSKTPRLTTPTLDEIFLDDMPHFNELLHCLLTEAAGRYCSSSQRSMITAEIAMYFRVLEHGNKGLAQFRADFISGPRLGRSAKREFPLDPAELRRINKLEFVPDQRVLAAIEARISDGTLTMSDRETFGAAAPPAMRQIFANVKLSTPACPAQPWWAFWRGL